MPKVTERFTQTVQDYIKYRPSYPPEVLNLLIQECGLSKNSIIADIGSGTGFLAKLLLDNGNTVYGVEPNQAMREAGEDYLKSYANFHSINATAEATTLAIDSVDVVTAATAFHWFDAEKTKPEFTRILKSNGWIVLIWNVRNVEQSSLMRDYENLIMHYGTDYQETNAKKFDKTAVAEFFAPAEMKMQSFPNNQLFDWQSLQGRLLSASYSLRPGDTRYDEMINALHKTFNRYEKNGLVEFLYQTKVYYGCVKK